jgi:hypothetical protein
MDPIILLRDEARSSGVLSWKAGNGSDGDALAAAFPDTWWSLFDGRQFGPFPDERSALEAGMKKANP